MFTPHTISLYLTIVCSVSFLFPYKSHASSIMRYRTNLLFYGGYSTDHRSVLYTNSEIEDWKNLSELAEVGGLAEKALLCGLGSGAWLAYPEPNFQSQYDKSNYAMLLIGDACIPADNINSVQAAGPINQEPVGLITFTEPFFATDGQWLTNETQSASGVKSFISPAGLSGEWTVEGDGKKICVVRPKDIISTGVCIFPDLSTQLNIASAMVTAGCEGMEGRRIFQRYMTTPEPESSSEEDSKSEETPVVDSSDIVLMQTCFGTYGAYKIVNNYLPLPQVNAICRDQVDESHKVGFYKIVDAWKFRMSPTRQEELNPVDLDKKRKDQNTPIRMKILAHFFEIFKAGCPNVPEIYFNLIRYLFMQHLKSVWEEVPEVVEDRNDTKLNWKSALQLIETCREKDQGLPPIPAELECIDRKRYSSHDAEDWEQSTMDLFLSGDNLDHVIEQVWLMLNYVSPVCAGTASFVDNFWVEFTNLFRRNFLMPLIQQWLNPGTWQVYYDYIFSGYSLLKGKRQIISCVLTILRNVGAGNPVDRPSINVKEFGSISKKKSPVDMTDMEKVKPSVRDLGAARRFKRSTKGNHRTAQELIRDQEASEKDQSVHGGEHALHRTSHWR